MGGIIIDTKAINNAGVLFDWQKAANTGDLSKMAEIASMVISEWPFDLDHKDVNSFRELSIEDLVMVLKAVGEAFADLFRKL